MSPTNVDLSSFTPKKELNNKIWVDKKINKRVRHRLLKIADDFLDYINVESKYCKDVIFVGSLANYNWSKYSDIDLHLVIDFKKINSNIDLVRDYFDSKRIIWNEEHNSLTIYGYTVELYVQDVNDEGTFGGVFSLEKNKWIVVPDRGDAILSNISKIKQKSSDLMNTIDDLEKFYNKYKSGKNINDLEKLSSKVKKTFDKLKKIRKSGLDGKDGEFSVGNIIYKVLRRSGHLETLFDLKSNTYDKINTIK